MKYRFSSILCLLSIVFISSCQAQKAEKLFTENCASCHMDGGQSKAPSMIHLGRMTPKSTLAAMEIVKMQSLSKHINKEDKIAIAEYLTKRKYSTEKKSLNYCQNLETPLGKTLYTGWGGNLEGSGFIPESISKLPIEKIPNLKLKWAFGIEAGTLTRAKPNIIGDYIIFGNQFGEVYCLSMHTGCVKWMFEEEAEIKDELGVKEDSANGQNIFFSDFARNSYALHANDGALIWKTKVNINPANAVTGTVAYYDDLVYVPLSSMEVVTAAQNNYEYCTSSGEIVALNANSGKIVWRHRVVSEMPSERGVNRIGAKKFGPSVAPVWSSPTIDVKRGVLYYGTGENYSLPATKTSDALQPIDLKTEELKWNFQTTSNDIYIDGCSSPLANCPDLLGPDLDFGMAPILTTRKDGSEVLIVGQKSGMVHCLNPETGKPIWQKRIGRGSALGGIHWGMAKDGQLAFAANSDWLDYGGEANFDYSPGLFAIDLMTVEVVWKSSPDPKNCRGKDSCHSTNSAAPTAIKGAIFAGSLDGHARAHDSKTGKVLWDFDTNISFETINKVDAKGGAIDGPGPVIVNGMVFFNSGYGLFGQNSGNVLLAFSPE